MSHSHLPVHHLIKQVELSRANRKSRGARPGWLNELLDRVTDVFEPFGEDARVGFECQAADDGWAVSIYLGSTEVVGGPADGRFEYSGFRMRLDALTRAIGQVEHVAWHVNGADASRDAAMQCWLELQGRIGESIVRLRVHAAPPPHAGPGFRRYADGRREAV